MSLILSTSFNNEEKNTRYISYSYLKLKKKNLKNKILIDHPWNDLVFAAVIYNTVDQ